MTFLKACAKNLELFPVYINNWSLLNWFKTLLKTHLLKQRTLTWLQSSLITSDCPHLWYSFWTAASDSYPEVRRITNFVLYCIVYHWLMARYKFVCYYYIILLLKFCNFEHKCSCISTEQGNEWQSYNNTLMWTLYYWNQIRCKICHQSCNVAVDAATCFLKCRLVCVVNNNSYRLLYI